MLALTRKIENLTETAGYANDPETRRDLAGQIDLHMRQKRQTEAERVQIARLEALSEQIAHVSADTDAWGYAQRRAALRALKCEVIVYEPGHAPARADVNIRLPQRGRLALPGTSTSDTYNMEYEEDVAAGRAPR